VSLEVSFIVNTLKIGSELGSELGSKLGNGLHRKCA
jgi:hypothetical protein